MRNKFLQLVALFSSVGVTNKKDFKEKMLKTNDPRSHSLSSMAEGVNPNALNYKRKNGKWKVKR